MSEVFWAEHKGAERWHRAIDVDDAIAKAKGEDLSEIWVCENVEEVLPEACFDVENYLDNLEGPDAPLEEGWVDFMAPTREQLAELNEGIKYVIRMWRGKYNLPRWWQVNSEDAYLVEIPSPIRKAQGDDQKEER